MDKYEIKIQEHSWDDILMARIVYLYQMKMNPKAILARLRGDYGCGSVLLRLEYAKRIAQLNKLSLDEVFMRVERKWKNGEQIKFGTKVLCGVTESTDKNVSCKKGKD